MGMAGCFCSGKVVLIVTGDWLLAWDRTIYGIGPFVQCGAYGKTMTYLEQLLSSRDKIQSAGADQQSAASPMMVD